MAVGGGGLLVGIAVGDGVGPWLGDADGVAEGLASGEALGEADGVAEGDCRILDLLRVIYPICGQLPDTCGNHAFCRAERKTRGNQ